LVPKVQQYCLSNALKSDYEVLDFLRNVTLIGILPPPQPIFTRRFQWSEASVVWFSSVLWGQVYIAANGYLGVYNGTLVSLFSVKTDIKDESKKDNGKDNRVGDAGRNTAGAAAPIGNNNNRDISANSINTTTAVSTTK
jgi:hypothetical protein